jgi:uncharacterized protein YjiS (DUF1127 family)
MPDGRTSLDALWHACATRLSIWVHRAVTRQTLCELDARTLADIGCTEDERRRECAKWFWQG